MRSKGKYDRCLELLRRLTNTERDRCSHDHEDRDHVWDEEPEEILAVMDDLRQVGRDLPRWVSI